MVRRLLGGATDLFLRDADPILVHCLASSALEHADLIAENFSNDSLKNHVMNTYPKMKQSEYKRLRNKNWTVIKHSHDRNGDEFDVGAKLAGFDDSSNDAVLFSGWHDFAKSGQALPIEAQALEAWFFNMYPGSVDPAKCDQVAHPEFEELPTLKRKAQKDALRKAIADARDNSDVMNHKNTDRSPLFLSGCL